MPPLPPKKSLHCTNVPIVPSVPLYPLQGFLKIGLGGKLRFSYIEGAELYHLMLTTL